MISYKPALKHRVPCRCNGHSYRRLVGSNYVRVGLKRKQEPTDVCFHCGWTRQEATAPPAKPITHNCGAKSRPYGCTNIQASGRRKQRYFCGVCQVSWTGGYL